MATVDPKVFRTYDIRALVPELVDETSIYFGKMDDPDSFQVPLLPEGVELIGRGLADFFGAETIVIGFDARLSSPGWAASLAKGITQQGVNVLDIGISTTDMMYYASGKLNLPAVEITASHSPKELNGMKLVREGASVVGKGSGMEELSDLVVSQKFKQSDKTGTVTKQDLLPEYVEHLIKFVDIDKIKPFKILADAGNGVGGLPAKGLFAKLPQLSVTELYFDPNGNFPNHPANPFERENIAEMIRRIPAENFDFGVAWDGDADRCIFLDEKGEPVPGDFVTALVARHFLKLNPGAAIVYDLRASWAVRDTVLNLGGKPISERVGHSYIKRTMRAENAVFGGEVSGHYYFREHYYADNGDIPLLSMLQILSEADMTMTQLVASLGEYHISGEINSSVADTNVVLERIREKYSDAHIDERDGVTVEYPDWHFNVRPSANDPVIRLNLEAKSDAQMQAKRDEVLALIRYVDF